MAKVAGTSVVRGVRSGQAGEALRGMAAGAAEGAQRREQQRQFNVQSEETKRQFDTETKYKYDQLQEMARQNKLSREHQERLLKIQESGLFGRQAVTEAGLGERQRVSEAGLGARQRVSESGLYGRQAAELQFRTEDREARLAHETSERAMDRSLQWNTATMQDATNRYGIWARRDTAMRGQTLESQARARRLEFEQGLTPIRDIAVSATGGDVSNYANLPPEERQVAAVNLAKQSWPQLAWEELSDTDKSQLVAQADAKLLALPKLEERYAESVKQEALAAGAAALQRAELAAGKSGRRGRTGGGVSADDYSIMGGKGTDIRDFDMVSKKGSKSVWSAGTGFELNVQEMEKVYPGAAAMVSELEDEVLKSVSDAEAMMLNPDLVASDDFRFQRARASGLMIESVINSHLPENMYSDSFRDFMFKRAFTQVERAYFGGDKVFGEVVPTKAALQGRETTYNRMDE